MIAYLSIVVIGSDFSEDTLAHLKSVEIYYFMFPICT